MGAISVSHLGKAYKHYPTPWSRLAEWALPGSKPRHTLKWVLKDISFTVNSGEAVGIIGVNGAGKSTLLKMMAGTVQPTTGSVCMTGRVAALLELGMGFHPDFTGRQNAFMAGQLLGYAARDVAALMPAIASFAEIGDYLDQPVRVYSSGMQMRLAFAVATAHRPDILIVDEALSVGDAYFQHKSFDRIRNYRKQGTTLLIVSHDKDAIQSICDRAILLSAAGLAMEGEPQAVMDYYNAMLAQRENHTVRQTTNDEGKMQTVSGTGEAIIENVALCDQNGRSIDTINVGQQVQLKVVVKIQADLPELVIGYVIKDRLGQPIFGTNSHHLDKVVRTVRAGGLGDFTFRFAANLGPGTYSVAVALHASSTHITRNYEWRDFALIFNVINADKATFVGSAWLPPALEYTYR